MEYPNCKGTGAPLLINLFRRLVLRVAIPAAYAVT